jgi:hypothetical protein
MSGSRTTFTWYWLHHQRLWASRRRWVCDWACTRQRRGTHAVQTGAPTDSPPLPLILTRRSGVRGTT